jgi:hypothetical protein
VLTPVVLSILIFGSFALAFDGVWSVVALRTRSRYASLAWVSFLIYFAAGFVAGSGAHGLPNGLTAGMLVGAAVSAIDCTLGWWISAAVGPGRPEPGQSFAKLILVAVVIVIYGALAAAFGGMLSEWL